MLHRRVLFSLASCFVAGLLLTPIGNKAVAAPAASPEAFIGDLTSQALKALSDNASPDQREQRFAELLEDHFDIPRISRFVLGRYWLSASDQEKQEFVKLFQTYVVRAYSNRFSEYTGETVKVVGTRVEGESGAVVMSQIIRPQGGAPIKVDWRVQKNADDYRIIDVNVEGISMALTQKQEFASVIERNGGGVAGLNKALQSKLDGATNTAQQ